MHNPDLHTPYWMNVEKLCLLKYGYLIDSVATAQVWNRINADSKFVLMFKVVNRLLFETCNIVHRVSRSGMTRDRQKCDDGKC